MEGPERAAPNYYCGPGETERVGLQQDREYVFSGSNSSESARQPHLGATVGSEPVLCVQQAFSHSLPGCSSGILAQVPHAHRQGWV